jgi:catechol 2,3-dioxygenase-like lactoylglutathione lyase family enzyme
MIEQRIAQITLVVNDYDEAIKFYTEKLNFVLIEDTKLSNERNNKPGLAKEIFYDRYRNAFTLFKR